MKFAALAVPVLLTLALPVAAQESGGGEAQPLGAEESAALQAAECSGLDDLRAAAYAPDSRLELTERVVLRDLAQRNPDLESLRAGELDLTDREVKIILITAGIVIVLALIL
jgi:hypothetical protein